MNFPRFVLCLSLCFLSVARAEDEIHIFPTIVIIADNVDRESWGKTGAKISGKGLLFTEWVKPFSPSMIRVAVTTGRHAFYSSVYGEFPSHKRFIPQASEPYNFVPDLWHWISKPVFPVLDDQDVLIIGGNFAWMKNKEIEPRVEERAITPEDLGTILLLSQKRIAEPFQYGGRDVRHRDVWPDLPTHIGAEAEEPQPEKLKYNGGRVLSSHGIWNNGLELSGRKVDELTGTELASFMQLGSLYQSWWQNAVRILRKGNPIPVGAELETFLDPNDWCPSVVEIGLSYMPEKNSFWSKRELQEKIRSMVPPGFGGSWKVDVKKQGNYEFVFSLNKEKEKERLFFRKGEIFIKMGNGYLKMELLDNADIITVNADLMEGVQQIEINVTGQGEEDSCLSVPYLRLKYAGPRITPVPMVPQI